MPSAVQPGPQPGAVACGVSARVTRARIHLHVCLRAHAHVCARARVRARARRMAHAHVPSDTACSPSHATRPRRASSARTARAAAALSARTRASVRRSRFSRVSCLARTIAGRSSHATVAPGDAADCVCMRERTSVRRTQQSCAYPTDVRTVRHACESARTQQRTRAHARMHARTSARNYAHNNHSRTHAHAHAAHVQRSCTRTSASRSARTTAAPYACGVRASGASHSTSHRPAPSRSTCGGPIVARMRTSAALALVTYGAHAKRSSPPQPVPVGKEKSLCLWHTRAGAYVSTGECIHVCLRGCVCMLAYVCQSTMRDRA